MATARLGAVRRVIDRCRAAADDRGDGELLRRYSRDRDQSAFAGLVRRHGPMVLGVCRRVLRDHHAAEDAFQATFLVLARRADAVRPPGLVGPWLHGVAYRTALKARGRAFRRRQVEHEYAEQLRNQPGADGPRLAATQEAAELAARIDEQLNALPEKYRLPLVLCGVQGLGKAEAAERLGLPEGTVSSRLARGRELLRDRLTRRGVVVPAVLLASVLVPGSLRAAVPTKLTAAAAEAAGGLTPIPPVVLALSNEVVRTMTLAKWKFLAAVAFAAALTGGGFGVYAVNADDKKPAAEKPADKPAKPNADKPGDKPKPEGDKPTAEKPKPDSPDKPKPETPDKLKPKPEGPDKPKPEGEKKLQPAFKLGGKVVDVKPADRVIVVMRKRDSGPVEEFMTLAPDAKVFVDGKPADLKAVPKGALASFALGAAKDGQPTHVVELRVTGSVVTGLVSRADETSLTINLGGKEGDPKTATYKITPDTKVTIGDKDVKAAELRPGDKVTVTLTSDESAVLTVQTGNKTRPEGGDKPKPETPDKTKPKPDGDKKPEKPGEKKPDGDKSGAKKPEGDKPKPDGEKKPEGEKKPGGEQD